MLSNTLAESKTVVSISRNPTVLAACLLRGRVIVAGARTAPAPSALRLAPVRNLHTFRVILNTALLLGGSTQQVQATLLGRTHTVLNAAKSVLDILSQ